MGKVAFCWELGGGLGHITGFLPIAKHLQERGHEVIYIVKELLNTDKLVGQQGFKVYQAPLFNPKMKRLPPPMSYAEILFRFGFIDGEKLTDMVLGWENILQSTAPDLAVFDHSPTANVAARSVDVKRALFGTGFCAPPQITPIPSIRPWAKVPLKRLQNSEAKALQSINTALERTGAPLMEKLKDLFDCDENFLATFPELDHYQNRGPARYWGARMSMDEGEDPVWPDVKPGPKIFAYLKAGYKDSPKVLEILKGLDANVLVYAAGFAPAKLEGFRTERMTVVTKMLNLIKICRDCDLVICHAGHATVARSLLSGIPVVMLPTQVEQFLMSSNVSRFGAGTMVNLHDKNRDYSAAIKTALHDENIRSKAREFADRHADFSQKEQISGIVDRIEEIIGPAS